VLLAPSSSLFLDRFRAVFQSKRTKNRTHKESLYKQKIYNTLMHTHTPLSL